MLKHRSIHSSENWDEYSDYYKEWKHKENSANNIRIVDNLLSDSQLYG